jgi:hypothetical protein
MSRALIIIQGKVDRERAVRWVRRAPAGTRLEFRETKRTIPQNDRMYAMLTDIARQRTHCGRRYTVDQWKCIFMHALGQEVEFIPSLDEKTFIPLVYRSSELSKAEMSALIELMLAWGAENGVHFHDRQEVAA